MLLHEPDDLTPLTHVDQSNKRILEIHQMKIIHYLLLVAIAGVPLPASGQQPTPLGAARVTLIAGVSPSKGARTEVVRQARRTPQNVVLVDQNANADDLGAALAVVGALRAQYGDSLANDLRAKPEYVRHGTRWATGEYRKWLQAQLVRLRQAPERELKPFGFVRAVQVTLPAPSGTVTSTGAPK
jgi:hypothetical protein